MEQPLNKKKQRNDETKDDKKEKPFRFQSKSAFLTYPQCDKGKEWLLEFLKQKGAKLCVIGEEEHHETLGKHLHAYVEFNKKIDTQNPRFFDNENFHPNIGMDKSNGQKATRASKTDMIKYVIKDGNYIEFGIDVEEYLDSVKDKRAYMAKELMDGKKTLYEAVEEEPKLLYTLGSIQKNLSLFQALKKQAHFEGKRTCYWIYGSSGIGKSYGVRQLFPSLYVKDSNKWWDGYVNQDAVLMDDLDSEILQHHIKIWSDNYAFVGETKGGSIFPSYNTFIVTSNFTIDELYKVEKIKEAIKRRFRFINADEYIGENGFFDFAKAKLEIDLAYEN